MSSGNFKVYNSTGCQVEILRCTTLRGVKWKFYGVQLYRVSSGNFMVYNSTGSQLGILWNAYNSTGCQLGILWNTALQGINWEIYGIQLYWVSSGNFVEYSSIGCQVEMFWNTALQGVKWEFHGIQIYRVSSIKIFDTRNCFGITLCL